MTPNSQENPYIICSNSINNMIINSKNIKNLYTELNKIDKSSKCFFNHSEFLLFT